MSLTKTKFVKNVLSFRLMIATQKQLLQIQRYSNCITYKFVHGIRGSDTDTVNVLGKW